MCKIQQVFKGNIWIFLYKYTQASTHSYTIIFSLSYTFTCRGLIVVCKWKCSFTLRVFVCTHKSSCTHIGVTRGVWVTLIMICGQTFSFRFLFLFCFVCDFIIRVISFQASILLCMYVYMYICIYICICRQRSECNNIFVIEIFCYIIVICVKASSMMNSKQLRNIYCS